MPKSQSTNIASRDAAVAGAHNVAAAKPTAAEKQAALARARALLADSRPGIGAAGAAEKKEAALARARALLADSRSGTTTADAIKRKAELAHARALLPRVRSEASATDAAAVDGSRPAGLEPHLLANGSVPSDRTADADPETDESASTSPEQTEARGGLHKAESAPASSPNQPIVIAQGDAHNGVALLNEGRSAFKAQNYPRSEENLLAALRAGADESECRLHLARIYNLEQEWQKALEQWIWLRDHNPTEAEPHLQIARAQFRLGQYAEARAGFEEILRGDPDHAEARQLLARIAAIDAEQVAGRDWDDGADWLSIIPADTRWLIARELLLVSIGSLENMVGAAAQHTSAIANVVDAYGGAAGELNGHRQLYGLQTTAIIEKLTVQLREAKRSIREIKRRTDKILETFVKYTANPMAGGPLLKVPFPRADWRDSIVRLALGIYQEHGFEAALSWLYRTGLVEDRPVILADFGAALRDIDRGGAIRAYWMAYGAAPSARMAERMASRMFQLGDLSNCGALIRAAPAVSSSPVITEMRSSVALFKNGVALPSLATSEASARPGRLAYVASGSLPFQAVGYTIRTHQLLTALIGAGVECVCFTRPGYPWDRPRALTSGIAIEQENRIGNVTYMHTPLPDADRAPETLVEQMSSALEAHFRTFQPAVVQAASNSRNALPALIAAHRVGAKFVYEVRGLWELTAASRFAGWEATERYELDRRLEVLVATHADHVLTITNGVAHELARDGVAPEKLSLLPNAVDPEAFRPIEKNRALMTELGLHDDDFTAVYAGSLTNYEGLDDLIIALSLMRNQGVRTRLVIAGDGEARQELEEVAAAHGMIQHVQFLGRIRPDAIEAYVSLADVVAIPRKPFKVCEVVTPLKPFEAMSMAKPVVLSDLPALREIVSDGKTGLLCRPADPASLANTLMRLAQDPQLRTELGQAAREWIIAHRSWSENAAGLIKFYEQISGPFAHPASPQPPLL